MQQGKGTSGQFSLFLLNAYSILTQIKFRFHTSHWELVHWPHSGQRCNNSQTFLRVIRQIQFRCSCPVCIGEAIPNERSQNIMLTTAQDAIGVKAGMGYESFLFRCICHSVFLMTTDLINTASVLSGPRLIDWGSKIFGPFPWNYSSRRLDPTCHRSNKEVQCSCLDVYDRIFVWA